MSHWLPGWRRPLAFAHRARQLPPRLRARFPTADAHTTQKPQPQKPQVSDIKRLNALASDTAIHAREHVLVPTRPLAPPGEDRAQLALARLLSGFPPAAPQAGGHPHHHGGRRRAGMFCSDGGGGGPGSSMRSGASSRTAGGGAALPPLHHWGVSGGGGGDVCGEADDGECSGGAASPFSRRSDRTVSASEPGDVELIDRAGVGGVGGGVGGGGGLGGAARALAERVVSRRGRSQQQQQQQVGVVVGPSPSAPNLGAMLHRLSSASNGVAEFFGGAGASAAGSQQQQQPPPPPPKPLAAPQPLLPPLPRRASASSAGQGSTPLLRQLSTAFGTTALATVDALTRAASQPALGGAGGGGGGGGGLPMRKRD